MDPVKNISDTIKMWEGKRPEWDDYFGCIAQLTASRSPCSRLKVGCVLVNENRIVATGYNGFLVGAPHESIVKNDHEQATVHAEQNAIADAAKCGKSLAGATAYVTHYPCVNCFKSLVQSGITTIKYYDDYKNDEVVLALLKGANTRLIKMKKTEKPEENHVSTMRDPAGWVR